MYFGMHHPFANLITYSNNIAYICDLICLIFILKSLEIPYVTFDVLVTSPDESSS